MSTNVDFVAKLTTEIAEKNKFTSELLRENTQLRNLNLELTKRITEWEISYDKNASGQSMDKDLFEIKFMQALTETETLQKRVEDFQQANVELSLDRANLLSAKVELELRLIDTEGAISSQNSLELKEIDEKCIILEAENGQLIAVKACMEDKVESLERKLKHAKEIEYYFQKTLPAVREELDQLKCKFKKLEAEKKHISANYYCMKEENSKLKLENAKESGPPEVQKLRKEIDQLSKEVILLEARKKRKSKQLKRKKKRMGKLKLENKNLKENLQRVYQNLMNLKDQLSGISNAHAEFLRDLKSDCASSAQFLNAVCNLVRVQAVPFCSSEAKIPHI